MNNKTVLRNSSSHKKIGIMGPFGYGNLGDAAIQEAMLQHIDQRFPQAEVIGFSLNPVDTEKRHGIKTYPLGRMSSYGWAGRNGVDRPFERIQKIADRMRNAPNRFIRLAGKAVFSAPLELLSIWKASKMIKGMDAFIVSGGGQLDDYWGGAWHHPYTLFIWALLARLRNVKFFVVSVGAGPLDSPVSRQFDRMALSLAQYRSYRDVESREFIKGIGFKKDDPIYPDLAQSLIVHPVDNPLPPGTCLGTVGIGPMSYFDPRVWPEKDSRVYQSYLSKLAEFSGWLLRKNFRIILFPGETTHDIPVIEDLLALILKNAGKIAQGNILYTPAYTVDALMEQLLCTDVVVASRFHGVLLAQLIHRPVLALSYHPKIDSLMADTAEAEYCLPINSFQVNTAMERFEALWSNRFAVRETLKKRVEDYRLKLDNQYDHIFSAI